MDDIDPLSCYRALLARDRRFDGVFFTCVRTTGIYCRPICPARPPKLENCRFVATASAAQEAGFRACLRCRPDAAPESPAWRGTSTTVARALRMISDGALDDGSVSKLAGRLGVGERHLRRLFVDHLGASPLTVALTRRILLAKQLVHDSDLSMIEIAAASGFSSLRRFNETFRDQFGRPPSALRQRAARSKGGPQLTILLPYRVPYDWDAMLAFLKTRAIPCVEQVESGVYSRTFEVDGQRGLIYVADEPDICALKARIQVGDLSMVTRIVARLKRLFDTDSDPQAINHVLGQDDLLAPLVERRPGLRLPGAWDGFELGVRAILGQQISVAAASSLAGRLAQVYGVPLAAPVDGLNRYFPSTERLAGLDIENAGFPRARAKAVVEFARAIDSDTALLDGGVPFSEAIARLKAVYGIGVWTSDYIAMRALKESNAFPRGDAALARIARGAGLQGGNKDLEQRSETWRPWRAYGVMHLWTADMEARRDAIAA
ncbi:MAG: helix-turn-helix domain-containing protein [Hyphomicrobiaceae bacterium]|nr:helix-turn-helix domain-containing protein [Hyphomicrobiaceae bacterium]